MQRLRPYLFVVFRHPLSFFGGSLASGAALLFLVMATLQWMGFAPSPYLGIITFMALPGLLAAGLVAIPLGVWLDRRRRAKGKHTGPEFPVLDLNRPRVRTLVMAALALTSVNLAILSVGTYQGIQAVSSRNFCANACHEVMVPEAVTHQASTHASVECVKCHVGAGAKGFVASKIQGAQQLLQVLRGDVPRPVPPPLHLPHAEETCRHCHATGRNQGQSYRHLVKYTDEETAKPLHTIMMLKVGGPPDEANKEKGWHGIHRHVEPGFEVRYVANKDRTEVNAVEVKRSDGSKSLYLREGAPPPAEGEEAHAGGEKTHWRTMDCTDCHNRVAHPSRTAEEWVDRALQEGGIPLELPFIRREAVRLVKEIGAKGASQEALVDQLSAFYAQNSPGSEKEKAEPIRQAAKTLAEILAANTFPLMNVRLGTYRNLSGHEGCNRCHEGNHKTAEGKVLPKRCETCHTVVATEEEEPEILSIINP